MTSPEDGRGIGLSERGLASEPLVESTDAERLGIGAALVLGGTLLGRGLQVGFHVLLARSFGAAALGVFAIAWAVFRLISVVAPLGLHNAVLRFGSQGRSSGEGNLRSLAGRCVRFAGTFGVVFAALLWALAPWFSDVVFNEPRLLSTLRFLALSIPLAAGLRVVGAATRVNHTMHYSVLAEELVQPAAALLLMQVFVALGGGVDRAALAVLISYCIGFLLAGVFLRLEAPGQSSGLVPTSGELLAFSLPTAMSGIVAVSIIWIDRLYVGYFRTTTDVGFYQAASQISLLAPLVLSGFNQIFTPMMADLYNRDEHGRLLELYRVSTKWATLVILPVAATAMVLAESLLVALFGSGFESAAVALRIIMIGQLLNVATGPVGVLLMMSGNQRLWMWQAVAALGLNLALNTALVPRFGLAGAAWATSASLIVLFSSAMLAVNRKLNLSPYDRRGLKLLIVIVAATSVAALVRMLGLDAFVGTIVALAGTGLATVGLWALLGFDSEDREILGLLLRRLVAGRSAVRRS